MPHSTLALRWIAMGLSLLASAPAIAQPGQPSVAPAKPAAPDPANGLDRAVAALDRLAGADTDAIFAVPTAAQRETVARLAGPALADADAHQAWAIAEARRLMALIQDESVPEADRNAVGPRLNELREAVLAARLPVVRGRLLAALAGAETDAARRAQRARDAVAALENGEGGSVAAEAVRRVTHAGALILQGPPLGDPRLDVARELLSSVVDLPVGDDPTQAASPRARCEALAGLAIIAPSDALDAALAALRTGAAPLGAPGVELVAGAEARARQRLARAIGTPPAEAFASAAAPLLALLHAPELAEPGPARDAAWSRIAALAPPDADPASLPPAAALAVAIGAPPRSAPALFARAAGATDAAISAEALWRLGQQQRSADAPLPEAWAELIRRHPPAPWSRRALTEIARSFAADAQALKALDADAESSAVAATRRRYALPDGALLAALRQAPAEPAAGGSPAAWRYLAAEAAVALLDPFLPADLERVLADLDAVPPGSDQAARAPALAARAARRALWSVEALPPAQREAAAEALAARIGGHALLKADAPLGATAAITLARQQLAAGRASAAVRTLRAAPDAGPATSAVAAEAALLLAVALRADDKPDDALATLRALTDAFEARGRDAPRPEVYWRAWAESLEILSQRADQRGAVRVRIGQLELIDPRLGGGEAARRIARVKALVR